MNDSRLVATRSHPDQQATRLPATERTVSLVAGAAVLLDGLRRGGFSGAMEAGLGLYGVVRGAYGHCPVKSALAPTPYEEAFDRDHGWPHSNAVTRSITIGKPLNEVVAFIRDPHNVAPLVSWIDHVEALGDKRWVWTAHAPRGRKIHWTLTLVEEQSDLLRWSTGAGARWEHDVSVYFKEAPADRGTEVKVIIVGKPLLGKLGHAIVAALSLFTEKALLNLLHGIKQQLETGEVSTHDMRPEPGGDGFYMPSSAGEPSRSGHNEPSGEEDTVKTGVAVQQGGV
ncbi:SRPBCC family protein [Pseudomonas sp. GD03842]|uniref:SRPBCC family protein n=1 Tax=Pseudomonas sp. GD03842 TaxID=2975385 RepID=UPI0024484D2A|nr:SRPBCC family protein [Pseudomonas sp. GD03842]MDH0747828.1 SRPBCC family protein [Pseudomonas sp. GD03842]